MGEGEKEGERRAGSALQRGKQVNGDTVWGWGRAIEEEGHVFRC